jgi:hypothetical protein
MVPPRTLLASPCLDFRFLAACMWCSTCQQDVPGLGSPGSAGGMRCGKCGDGLESIAQPTARVEESSAKNAPVAMASVGDNAALEKILRSAPLGEEDWALEAELRGVQRLLGSLKSRPGGGTQAVAVHASHRKPGKWHTAEVDEASADDASTSRKESTTQPRGQTAAWLILSLGLAVFACGGVLLAWSIIGQRDDLWPIGMPLALVGQAALIVGLVLQLDGLSHSTRKTTEALSELDGELKNVRQATTLLSSTQAGGAQSFYLHLAEGASPQLLLADLKGQMDLLAQQMARQGER